MTLNRAHLKWLLAVLLAGSLAGAAYRQSPYPASGSSPTGLLFGLSAASLIGFAALLSCLRSMR